MDSLKGYYFPSFIYCPFLPIYCLPLPFPSFPYLSPSIYCLLSIPFYLSPSIPFPLSIAFYLLPSISFYLLPIYCLLSIPFYLLPSLPLPSPLPSHIKLKLYTNIKDIFVYVRQKSKLQKGFKGLGSS